MYLPRGFRYVGSMTGTHEKMHRLKPNTLALATKQL